MPAPSQQQPGVTGLIWEPCKLLGTGEKRVGYFLCLYIVVSDDYVDTTIWKPQ